MTLDLDRKDYEGACHCGAVRFHVHLSQGLHSARRCDCSMCRMRGVIAVTAKLGDLNLVQGQGALRLYQFGTMTAKHYFCGGCGIYTHHQRRSNPQEYGVNVACLQGISPFDFDAVQVMNGHAHPSDHGRASGIAGILRFERV